MYDVAALLIVVGMNGQNLIKNKKVNQADDKFQNPSASNAEASVEYARSPQSTWAAGIYSFHHCHYILLAPRAFYMKIASPFSRTL